jgi:hypothetical protein
MNLDDPVAVTLRVAALLEQAETPHALYGGLAVAAYGAPRETKDADLAVVSAGAAGLAELLGRDRLRAAVAFERVRFGGLWVGRVTLLGGPDDSGLNTVDLVEPASPRYARLAIERAALAPLRERDVRLLLPEDVVLFKLLSTRERDLEDAASILIALAGRIDLEEITAEVERLAAETPGHEVRDRWRRCRELADAGRLRDRGEPR